jgi:hypothetical protein
MGLHVRVVGTEQCRHPLPRQLLHLVDELVAAVAGAGPV